MDNLDNISIFTESSESMGLMYDNYKGLPDVINKFMNMIKDKIELLISDPYETPIDLRDDIANFKNDIELNMTAEAIYPDEIKLYRKKLKKIRSDVDDILDDLIKLKNKMSFGGNLIRGILKRPKVYSKDMDSDNYEIINNSIRNINRGLDWIEKIIIDIYNLIDQDSNILTIVDKVYIKKHIYEDGELVPESLPKQTDAKEANKNGVRRKQLYMEFIEYAKSVHRNNLFGSVFDKDAFQLYSFVPNEMRYFYRLANPLLCVLKDSLTFFALSELKNLNKDNKELDKMLIFAAYKSGELVVFNKLDKKIYQLSQNDNNKIENEIAPSFDKYLEILIGIKIIEESFKMDN